MLIDLNAIAVRIPKDNDPEKILIKQAVANLRQLIADQGAVILDDRNTF